MQQLSTTRWILDWFLLPNLVKLVENSEESWIFDEISKDFWPKIFWLINFFHYHSCLSFEKIFRWIFHRLDAEFFKKFLWPFEFGGCVDFWRFFLRLDATVSLSSSAVIFHAELMFSYSSTIQRLINKSETKNIFTVSPAESGHFTRSNSPKFRQIFDRFHPQFVKMLWKLVQIGSFWRQICVFSIGEFGQKLVVKLEANLVILRSNLRLFDWWFWWIWPKIGGKLAPFLLVILENLDGKLEANSMILTSNLVILVNSDGELEVMIVCISWIDETAWKWTELTGLMWIVRHGGTQSSGYWITMASYQCIKD